MTSIGLVPGFGKRTRNPIASSNGLHHSFKQENIGNIKKRWKVENINNIHENENDVFKYTQHQVDFFELRKKAEIAKLQHDFEQHLKKNQEELNHFIHQNKETTENLNKSKEELDKINVENKLLRKAFNIQNQQKSDLVQENNNLKTLLQQAAEEIKKLSHYNYTLQLRLQTDNNNNNNNNGNNGNHHASQHVF